MAEVTRRELAEQIGCTKQTVAKALREIDLEGHVTKRGQTEYYDEWAASAVADMLAPRFRKQADTGDGDVLVELLEHYKGALADSEKRRDAEAERHASEVERYRALVESLQDDLERLTGLLADERKLNAELSSRLADSRESLSAIASAPFWRRGALAQRALLPPAAGDGGER